MKKSLLSVIVLGLLGGLFLAGNSWGQFEDANLRPLTRTTGTNRTTTSEVRLIDLSARDQIELLMIELREAADDAKKAGITTLLQAAVVTSFDEDMKSRETELTKLEERLTKLRAQLDRRRKAKSEIIQLQIKVMVNEADGLGFSGASGINAVPFDGASPFGRTGVSRLGGPTRGTTNGPTPAPTDDDFTPRKK